MPSIPSSSLLAWIVGAFSIICIVGFLVVTKGNSFRNVRQLLKTDLLMRTLYTVWIILILVLVFNIAFSNPWRGTIVLVGAFLNVVMLVLVSSILPGRLKKHHI